MDGPHPYVCFVRVDLGRRENDEILLKAIYDCGGPARQAGKYSSKV
jgi:hypothetical protein